MGTYQSLAEWARANERRWERMLKATKDINEFYARGTLRDMKELTSGTISSNTLRQLGHPFAYDTIVLEDQITARVQRGSDKRKTRKLTGRTRIPRLPINKQSGDLRSSIQKTYPNSNATDVSVGDSWVKYAKYVLSPTGTHTMVARHLLSWREFGYNIPGEIEKRHRTRVMMSRRILSQSIKG